MALLPGKTVLLNQWSYIVWSKNNNILKLFINGIDTGWSMSHTNSIGPFEEMLICHHFDHGYFEGIFDEVNIYKRALSESEILEHYQQYAPLV